MDSKKAKLTLITVSIFFALAMIVSSYFIVEKSDATTVVFLLIAVWFVPFSYLNKKIKRK